MDFCSKEYGTKIIADSVVLTAIDKETGASRRVELPLQYTETANGIILSGEDMEGKPSTIVFFSEEGATRVGELRGNGPNKARCNDSSN